VRKDGDRVLVGHAVVHVAHEREGVVACIHTIVLLLSISWFAMNLLSTVRAYVGGEGLWSKAQKDAVHSLTKYATGEDERDYQQYLALLRVPLGDRRARLVRSCGVGLGAKNRRLRPAR
jgi:hypothetical protein